MPINLQDLVAPAPTAAPAEAAPTAPAPLTSVPVPPEQLAAAKPQPGTLQEPLAPKDEAKAQIPDEVLQVPAFRALLEGKPPAVSVSIGDAQKHPELQTIETHVEPLLYSGFGLYQAKDGKTVVFYNSQFIDGQAIKLADEKGKLDAVAAPYSELKSFFDQNIGEAAPPSQEPTSTPAAFTGTPAPASAQNKLATARLKSLSPGSPTSGPAPGQGRVLNAILKPTV